MCPTRDVVSPASLVSSSSPRQVDAKPPLQVGLDVLPLLAAAITSEQLQHSGVLEDCSVVSLQQGRQQGSRLWREKTADQHERRESGPSGFHRLHDHISHVFP